MPPTTFAECFCAQQHIPLEKYEEVVFKKVLYRRVRPFMWLIYIKNRNHFMADHDLIKAIANLTRMRDFAVEASRFRDHPYNRGTLRWRFGMRISTTRLRTLVKTTFLNAGITSESVPVEGGTRPPV